MIRFILRGLLRDRSRSTIPLLVVAVGVSLSVFMHAYVTGIMGDMVRQSAHYSEGHVKVLTRPYAEMAHLNPIDLSILNASELEEVLVRQYPELDWVHRINFSALVDVPDSLGETKEQGPAFVMGLDLLSDKSTEIKRLHLTEALIRGRLPQHAGEVLLSEQFAKKLAIKVGEEFTLIAATVYGNMAYVNFTMSGTIHHGSPAFDRGSILLDLTSARDFLGMEEGSAQILGFFADGFYHDDKALEMKNSFNTLKEGETEDEYEPIMLCLVDNPTMALYLGLGSQMGMWISLVFLLTMSLVLWNAGLLGGLRRYQEFGIRLAIGEEKSHVYRSLLWESLAVGTLGSTVGTAIGLFFAYLLQHYGLNIEAFSENASQSVMMPGIIRARITPVDFYIGFVPGLVSTLIGAGLAGIGVYRRETARLMNEL